MTKKQAIKKTRSVIHKMSQKMRDKVEKALNSGAIDLEIWKDDFLLPKLITSALLQDAIDQLRPIEETYQEEIGKIYKFI